MKPTRLPEPMLTHAEVCAWLRVGDVGLRHMCDRGEIPWHRVGRLRRYVASEVAAALRNEHRRL